MNPWLYAAAFWLGFIAAMVVALWLRGDRPEPPSPPLFERTRRQIEALPEIEEEHRV